MHAESLHALCRDDRYQPRAARPAGGLSPMLQAVQELSQHSDEPENSGRRWANNSVQCMDVSKMMVEVDLGLETNILYHVSQDCMPITFNDSVAI